MTGVQTCALPISTSPQLPTSRSTRRSGTTSPQSGRALAVNLMSQLSDYMLTDISTDEVLYISTELSGCNFDEENMQILQGNIQMGEQYEEYYLDDEAVQQTIIDLFYEEQK